jgi:hypothetical protein
MNEEQLKQSLEAIFQYARIHSVTKNNSEDELMAIIKCKKETFDLLFKDNKKDTKEKTSK